MRLAARQIFGEFTLREQGVDGDVLARDIDGSSRGIAVLISFVRLTSSRPSTGRRPLFLGVADLGLVTDDAHHMRLVTLRVEGIAHRFAVQGQTFVFPGVGLIPAA